MRHLRSDERSHAAFLVRYSAALFANGPSPGPET
jgi:hypothetical protein